MNIGITSSATIVRYSGQKRVEDGVKVPLRYPVTLGDQKEGLWGIANRFLGEESSDYEVAKGMLILFWNNREMIGEDANIILPGQDLYVGGKKFVKEVAAIDKISSASWTEIISRESLTVIEETEITDSFLAIKDLLSQERNRKSDRARELFRILFAPK